MKRAALYIRVSTEEQAKYGFSLAEQRHDLELYAAKHGYAVIGVYADEGNTARKALLRRKELQRLLNDIRAGHVDVILLKCLDRWFRNVRDYYKVQEVLDHYGVEWECTQEYYNTTTTNGRLMLNLKLSIAQNESDQTSDRIKYINQGKHRRKEEVTGKHPYGYEIKDKHLVVIEKDRPIIEFIFQQILAGYAAHPIAQKVYEQFGVLLDTKRVWRILRNKTYKGVRYGIPEYCPAIIPAETFDRVQAILSHNKRPVLTNRVFLFSGKIICPSCGNLLLGKRGNRSKADGRFHNPIYMCGNRYTTGVPHRSGKGCQYGGAVSESVIERYLLIHIRPLLEAHEASIRISHRQIIDYKSKIKSINAKLSRLKDLYIDGLIDKNTYKADYEKLQTELGDALQKSNQQIKVPEIVSRILADKDFLDTYAAMPKVKKRELWQMLLQSIELGSRPEMRGKAYNNFKITFV